MPLSQIKTTLSLTNKLVILKYTKLEIAIIIIIIIIIIYKLWINEWLEWAVVADGSRSDANAGSAQEYQDNEFRDKLALSRPAYPLFPADLWSSNATSHSCGQQPL